MNKNIFFYSFLFLAMGLISFLFVEHAQAQIKIPTKAETGLSDATVVVTLGEVAKFVTGIVGILALVMIVVAGVMYMTSGGDERRVDLAKRILIFAIVGLVVALVAFVIVVSISAMLGAGGASTSTEVEDSGILITL